jgi:hypothetical protein
MDELYGIPEMPDQDDIDYMGDAITPLQAKAEEVSQAFGFTEQLILDFLHRLYDGKLDPKQEIDAPMWEQVRTVLREAVAKGYDEPNMPDADEVFYEQLQHNTDVFAAFKVHRMQNDMAHMLLDSNGKLKTFEQWSNDVQTIASHQVGHWLQTEYDTAVIRAHQAADWQQFEREKDVLPNLKWMPSTSAHPGADHRIFWGTVRAINDPFWSSHRPGDRWNCKCSLSSTDEPVTQVPDAAPSDEPQNGLENNPGVDGKLFSDNHPYISGAYPGAKKAVDKFIEHETEIGSNVPGGLDSRQQVEWIKNVHSVEDALNIKQGAPMTHKEANGHKSNPNFQPKIENEWSSNCQSCVVSYELRRRGYDVESNSRVDGSGSMTDKLARKTEMVWKTVDGNPVNKQNVKGTSDDEINEGINSLTKNIGRYHIDWIWKQQKITSKVYGHIIVAERFENGGFRLYDPQTGENIDWKSIVPFIDISKGINILRVDNLIPDEALIKEIVHKK